MKPLPALMLFVAGLLVGTALSYLALRPLRGPLSGAGGATAASGLGGASGASGADASGARADTGPRAQENGATVVDVPRAEIVDHDAWRKQGFVEMTPPVRLPSDGAERDRIEVWLRIPQGALIETQQLADGRKTLRFPAGTIADRVESFGYAKDDVGNWRWSVTDVRGTRIEDGKELFHVFVPAGPAPRERLIGWEWTRGDGVEQQAATELLAAHLEGTRTLQDQGRAPSPEERRVFIDDYRRNNDCAKCHAHDKSEQTTRAQGIHRATDASGFYLPLAVLMDTNPLEQHRARDMNVGDPFLAFSCPDGTVPSLAERAGGARVFRCEVGAPSATLDVRKALAAKDPRTVALCSSRAYLRAHMNEEGRALFAAAFSDCAL